MPLQIISAFGIMQEYLSSLVNMLPGGRYMAKVRAFDKNIKLGPDSGGEGKQGRRKAKRIPVEDFDLIRSQLQKGEYLLNDGRLMYKVPRSMFSGVEAAW